MSDIAVREVASASDLKAFVRLPFAIYSGDPLWVPPLFYDVNKRLDRKKNPFFAHSEAAYFLAERDGRLVGRIAAILNRRHLEIHADDTGFFGWFECEDDAEAAKALLDRAGAWVQERGCRRIRGPASFSLNEECGLLVEGFHRTPMMLTPWNHPYYEGLIRGAGFETAMDLNSYYLPVDRYDHERTRRFIKLIKKRENATLRLYDPKDHRREVDRIMAIYNDAWTKNWGFVPMTPAELEAMANEMKPLIDPRLATFVEVDGEPVGFSLVMPDVNLILKKLNGRLFPFGIIRILTGLKKVPGVRLMAMGVRKDYQKRGVDALLYHSAFEGARDGGRVYSELGWVLETNTLMHNTVLKLGAEKDRVHRLFDRNLPGTSQPGQ